MKKIKDVCSMTDRNMCCVKTKQGKANGDCQACRMDRENLLYDIVW